MQVNKYVPHYQRIPQKFDKKDFKIFEYGPETENQADRYEKIKKFIEDFDKVMIDTLMVDREHKYNQLFRHDIMSRDLIIDSPDSENTYTNKKIKKANKALAEYDSDEERENANVMFVQDIQRLRKYFIGIVNEQVAIQEEMQENFNQERKLFLECTKKGQNNEDDLKNTII